ncbi:hypothetical protein PACTADRAFT_24703, partial [Pachysolen tannophilus NRRL Y-2460]
EDTELYKWLSDLNLSDYYRNFVDKGVSFDLIPYLDKHALREIGIEKIGDRLVFEISINKLRTKELYESIPWDRVLKIVNDRVAKIAADNYKNNNNSTLIAASNLITNANSNDNNNNNNNNNAVSEEKNTSKSSVTFILQDGSTKKINVSGCFNSDSIKRKIFKKLNIKSSPLQAKLWDTYVIDSNDQPHLMFDVELVTVCHSPDRIEKNRIILCEKDEKPSLQAIETSNRIRTKYQPLRESMKRNIINNNSNNNDNDKYNKINEANKPNIRKFFDQRPPSSLISTNLAQYFPDTEANKLQETVKNSVRMSRLINNPRFSMLSGGSSIRNRPESIISSRLLNNTSPSSRTIGSIWMNNINALDNAVTDNTVGTGGLTDVNTTLKPWATNNSSSTSASKLINNRLSIISSNDNITSRIELFSSDEEEEIGEEYLLRQLSLEEEENSGPKNWLKGAKIGSGSFGVVFLGMNSLTGELMAVKQVELPKDKDKNDHKLAMIEALKQETILLKDLHHENIVSYLGSNSDSQFLNIFLEYVPGGSVSSMLNNYGPFEEPLIRNFIRQTIIGLNYLHGEHIIHRDIKGANILIDSSGTVKISDFGISKKINTTVSMASKRASLQGSVYWMAPEVVKQTTYTSKADIWSVGCLVIEMFTCKHPFPDFSQMQAIFKIGTHTIPEIPEWATDEAKHFLTMTFELDYKKRPTAAELLNDEFLNTLIMSK